MGSYAGGSDWDDLPAAESFEAFRPKPAQKAAPHAPAEPEPSDAVEAEAREGRPRLDVIVAFDTTGSMTPWVENVQQKMEYFAGGLLKLLDARLCLIGVGDHGDGRNMLQIRPFSSDLAELKASIEGLAPTDGRDAPEAFECLFKVLNRLDTDDAPAVLVVITDSIPHGMEGYQGEDDGCPFGVDWREELDELRAKLKNVYLVSCAEDAALLELQRKIVAGNSFIRLNDFRRLTNLIMAICMDEVGELDYFMRLLEKQRGVERRDEVLALLGKKK